MDTEQLDYPKRRLLKFSAYAFLLTTAGILPAGSALARNGAGRHRADLAAPLAGMQVIGRAYLERYPEEKSRGTLLRLLESRSGSTADGRSGLSWEGLRKSIKDDFRTEDVVFLQDWCLARTEARLCALSVV